MSEPESGAAPPFEDTGYDPAASVYDIEYPACDGDELIFWSRLASTAGSRVLELGTGTGRVAIALARLGYHVTGLDASREMLARAQRKRAAQPADVSARLTFVHGDMRDFAEGPEQDLVFVAFNSFLLLPDRAARAACLASAVRRVRPGGVIGVDVFAANALDRMPDHEQVELLEPDAETGRRVTRERYYRHDRAADRGDSTLIYRLLGPDGAVETVKMGYSLALVSRDDMVDEFEAAGLEVTGVYGDHRERPWQPDSPNLLVVGRVAAR